jgi:DNA repair protein RecN (Recombination protein N)
MLEEISIKDLGVIQSATLRFTKGLTVITGETGAGKTMVLTALSLLLGKRSDSSFVRHGSEFTSVEGCWDVSGLNVLTEINETGAVIENNQLFLNRTVYKDGKSRAVIGGKTTPASVLATIGEGLVNIHGQSDQIRLKNTSAQREALDSFSGSLLSGKLESYKEVFNSWKALTARLKEVQSNMVARRQEYEILVSAVAEIEKVNPVAGEDEAIKTEIALLSNTENLSETAQLALNALSNEETEADVTSMLGFAARTLASVAELDPKVAELHRIAEEALDNSNALSSGLASYLDSIDTDVIFRLNEIQERLAALNTLMRKYGTDLNGVIEYWGTSAERVLDLDPEGSNVEALEKELSEVQAKLEVLVDEVSSIRTAKSHELEDAVNAELAGLAMAGNKLKIMIDRSSTYTVHGADEISFMLMTPGASEPRPIGRSASGGELSRIMLALEVVLANPDVTPTFIFDEVDSGVGGATAIEIGKRLSKLSREAQVIVVTHLPQVAAFADNHLRVLKTNSDSFTSTDVNQLSEEDRVNELARMLSGLGDSESGRTHAAELIGVAAEFKNS